MIDYDLILCGAFLIKLWVLEDVYKFKTHNLHVICFCFTTIIYQFQKLLSHYKFTSRACIWSFKELRRLKLRWSQLTENQEMHFRQKVSSNKSLIVEFHWSKLFILLIHKHMLPLYAKFIFCLTYYLKISFAMWNKIQVKSF